MSNTIRQPRKRPRRTSVNFRSLWWLLAREAAWQILCKRQGYTLPPYTRQSFATARGCAVSRLAKRMLYYHPGRRWIN